MFKRSWVRIPAPYTGWTCFHIYLLQKMYCLFEKSEINEKEAGVDLIKKHYTSIYFTVFRIDRK